MAAVGRGRAAGSAAHLQQCGGGEGAVPHARGQSAPRFFVLATPIAPFSLDDKKNLKVLFFSTRKSFEDAFNHTQIDNVHIHTQTVASVNH